MTVQKRSPLAALASTPVLVIGTIVAWAAVEAFRISRHEATISDDIKAEYKVWPTIGMLYGLVMGLLGGHWFFQ
ncbi:MAG: hypothetical protein ACYDCI_06620 [Candidatus Limnocylindrales bacterium]